MLSNVGEGLISAHEVCELLGLSSSHLCVLRTKLNLPEQNENRREVWYCAESYEKLKNYVDRKEKEREGKRGKELVLQLPANLEELKKEHPLVTDYRCFIEYFFPGESE